MKKINGDTAAFKGFVICIIVLFAFLGIRFDPTNGGAESPPAEEGVVFILDAGSVPPPNQMEIAKQLKLGDNAEKLELLMRQNGITDAKAVVCLLATAKHESGFNAQAVYYEKNGSVSRGVFQFNSRGLGRGVSPENLHKKEFQVKHLAGMNAFRQWYGETKTKNWSIAAAMTELTKRIIRCAKAHYPPRIKTAETWWEKVKEK